MILFVHIAKGFKVDKQGYADISKQVYDKEFDNKLNERLFNLKKIKVWKLI